jgi:hypothetical protein
MENENENPIPSPVAGPGEGGQQNTDPKTTPSEKPTGAGDDNETVPMSVKELNALKRDAGRWASHVTQERENRRGNRQRNNPPADDKGADDATVAALNERDQQIGELNSKVFTYETKEKVAEILEREEYKDLPAGVRRAIARNPLGFASQASTTVEDVMYDIEDYLEDELKNASPAPAQNITPGAGSEGGRETTPPAHNGGPSSNSFDPREGVENLKGQAASLKVLNNILNRK